MMTLQKIQTSNNWEQTYHALREHILRRKFGPNQKLLTPQLSEQLGVSPTPIRDALNRLESEGLVRTVSKVGTFVTPVDGNNVVDLIESRQMMEFWVIDKWTSYSAEVLDKSIDQIDAIVAQSRELLNSGKLEVYLQSGLDYEFHLELIRLGGNTKNVEMYKSLMNYRFFNLAGELVTMEMCRQSVEQHEAIVLALKSGDSMLIKQKITLHLDYSRMNLLDAIEQNGGFI